MTEIHPDQIELFLAEARRKMGRFAARTVRYRFLISLGYHPLTWIRRRSIRPHPEAVASPDVRTGGPRCGGCVHLAPLDLDGSGARRLKCWLNGGERVTRGDATTIRAWWPACTSYEAR